MHSCFKSCTIISVVILFTCKKKKKRVPCAHVVVPKCSCCALDGMFIVWRFRGLVDYLTSFSGVDLSSLMSLQRCSLSLLCQADKLMFI